MNQDSKPDSEPDKVIDLDAVPEVSIDEAPEILRHTLKLIRRSHEQFGSTMPLLHVFQKAGEDKDGHRLYHLQVIHCGGLMQDIESKETLALLMMMYARDGAAALIFCCEAWTVLARDDDEDGGKSAQLAMELAGRGRLCEHQDRGEIIQVSHWDADAEYHCRASFVGKEVEPWKIIKAGHQGIEFDGRLTNIWERAQELDEESLAVIRRLAESKLTQVS